MKKFFLIALSLFSVTLFMAQPARMEWSMKSEKISDCEYNLVFTVNIDKGWHIYSVIKSKGDDIPFPTAFYWNKSADYELVGKVMESKPHEFFDSTFKTIVRSHENKAVFTQKVKLLKSGPVSVTGKYEAQVCDENGCLFPPAKKFKFDLTGTNACAGDKKEDSFGLNVSERMCNCDTAAILSGIKAAPQPTGEGFGMNVSANACECDTAAILAKSEKKAQADKPGDNNGKVEEDIANMSWWAIFIQGLLGGFIALLTPCVFPMIPMNVSFFTKQSKTKQQGIRNALVYALFLVTIYVVLGLAITVIFGAGALHTISTNVWFNLAFFLLLLLFGISFLGAFEIVIPNSFINKMDAQSEKGGYAGIFFMAFTLALVSFSCTGPIIGTLLVQAANGGGITGPFWGMFGFSLGLAFPFALFAAFPGWLNSLPKSGGWLNAVKVVLGFLEIALAFKFASNADLVVQAGILTREVFITLWIVIFGLQSAYLLGAFKTAHDTELKHLSVTRLFFATVSLAITVYLIPGLWGAPLKIFSGVLPPYEYSESPRGFGPQSSAAPTQIANTDPEFSKHIEVNKNGIIHFKNDYDKALAYAKKMGKPLMVDYTGHACANCRKTEDNIWPDPEVMKRLNNEVVLVSLFVDDKRALDPKDYMTVDWYGEKTEITDIGDKFKYQQETLYGQSAQPLYVLLDHNEKPLNKVRGYNPDLKAYIKWLDEGINAFKSKK